MNENKNDGDGAEKRQKTLPPSPISGVSLDPATLWQPGKSANPGGAPKGKRLTTWIAEFQALPEDEWPTPAQARRMPAAARMAMSQIRKAMREPSDDDAKMDSVGLAAAAWAADRVEGKAEQSLQLRGPQVPTMSFEEARKIILDSDASKLEKF